MNCDKRTEKEMQIYIHMKNMTALFADMNEKTYGEALIPEVGLYWMSKDGTKLYKRSVSLLAAVTYDTFKTFDGSHWDEWEGAQKRFPEWEDSEYDQIPRGRVVFNMGTSRKDCKFIIYLPPQLENHKTRLLDAFKIPPEYARFDFSDEHYRL